MEKTTTLAKLAAYFALKARRRVAILTIDSYRITATGQLKTHGKIMELPVDVVESFKEMEETLKHRQDMNLILIDTADRSHRDRFRIRELKQFLDGFPLRKHLVLSCHTRTHRPPDLFDDPPEEERRRAHSRKTTDGGGTWNRYRRLTWIKPRP